MRDETLTLDAILDALDAEPRIVPRAAMEQALQRWEEIGPILRGQVQDTADGAAQPGHGEDALFRAIYLMAQCRDPLAYRPLCHLAAAGQRCREIVRDLNDDLAILLARVFDGDPGPLLQLVETVDADEFARGAALEAMAYLTAIRQIDREAMAGTLETLSETLKPAGSFVWAAWAVAIGTLGFAELMPLVEHAFKTGAVDEIYLELEDVRNDLAAALDEADPQRDIPGLHDIDDYDDVIGLMERWRTAPASEDEDAFPPEDSEPVPEPIRNPLRGVGRNDPCPCGSGRKYKKCCLAAEQG